MKPGTISTWCEQHAAHWLRSVMAPLRPWLLATPASRGIGLQLARRLLTTTDLPVVATTRKSIDEVRADILHGLENVDPDRLSVFEVDVTGLSPDAVPSLLRTLRSPRRVNNLYRYISHQRAFPDLISLPPPCLPSTRYPPSREVSRPDLRVRRPLHLPSKHPWPSTPDQTPPSVPTPKIDQPCHTTFLFSTSCTSSHGPHVRARRLHLRQLPRRLVFVPRFQSCSEPDRQDL